MVPETGQEFVLAFTLPVQNPDAGRHELRQNLGQLPQFEDAGIGVLSEIAFRKHSEPQKLLIMRLQMSEIAAQALARLHGIRCLGRKRLGIVISLGQGTRRGWGSLNEIELGDNFS